jgi:hypothetical protein
MNRFAFYDILAGFFWPPPQANKVKNAVEEKDERDKVQRPGRMGR